MHYMSAIRKILMLSVVAYSCQANASGQISYSAVNTVDADPGNEINKGDFLAEYSMPVYASADRRKSVSIGASIRDTKISFDASGVDDLDLLKVTLPITGNNVMESGKLVSWSLVPGLHGLADEMSDADARV